MDYLSIVNAILGITASIVVIISICYDTKRK